MNYVGAARHEYERLSVITYGRMTVAQSDPNVESVDQAVIGARVRALREASAAFVASRGLGLGPAREIALKLAEVLRLPALGFSAAELQHGPRAALSATTPVLMLRLQDETGAMVDTLADELRNSGIRLHLCGGPRGTLPWLGDDHPVTDAIAMLIPAYRMIEQIARQFGFDPDSPPHLSKVTETF